MHQMKGRKIITVRVKFSLRRVEPEMLVKTRLRRKGPGPGKKEHRRAGPEPDKKKPRRMQPELSKKGRAKADSDLSLRIMKDPRGRRRWIHDADVAVSSGAAAKDQ